MKKIVVLLVLVAAGLAAWYYLSVRFRKAPPVNALRMSGNIEAHQSDLSFKIQGRLIELPVQEGQWVEAGTVLARLDDEDYKQQVAADDANLKLRYAQLALTRAGSRTQDIKAAEQNMLDAQADLELKNLDYKRSQELYAKDAISAQTRDISSTNVKRAEAAYERAKQLYEEIVEGSRREQINIDRQTATHALESLRMSKIRLSYTVLRAPTSGVIVSRPAELGEVVGPGTPIVTLADLEHVWLRAYVSETDLGRIRWGQTARVTTDTYHGKTYPGKLSFIASDAEFTPKSVQTQVERVTLVYKIKIDIPNEKHELKPGMPADAVVDLLSAGAVADERSGPEPSPPVTQTVDRKHFRRETEQR